MNQQRCSYCSGGLIVISDSYLLAAVIATEAEHNKVKQKKKIGCTAGWERLLLIHEQEEGIES